MSDFWKKYKHPLWQEKRLRIMERDGFVCKICGGKDETLNVHHGYYERGKDPWDYDDDTMHTLCDSCHDENHALILDARKALARLHPFDMEFASGLLSALFDLTKKELPQDVIEAKFRTINMAVQMLSRYGDPFDHSELRQSDSDLNQDIAIGSGCGV